MEGKMEMVNLFGNKMLLTNKNINWVGKHLCSDIFELSLPLKLKYTFPLT